MLEHGGRLRQAATHYGIPLDAWLDLSTGINPNGWPVPAIPPNCWQRLPEDDDDLLPAARLYYQNDALLAVAGSQAAIQALPLLRPNAQVGLVHPAYAEHANAWHKAGHTLTRLEARQEAITASLDALQVLILINPNNPTGQLWHPDLLLSWHQQLAARGGWLIIDEAFMDGIPEHSLVTQAPRPGLILLRSIGKFFGLAGIRCGFVIAEPALLAQLAEHLGPWTISHPARWIAAQALSDTRWQDKTRTSLAQQGQRLQHLLSDHGLMPTGGCHLFQWVCHAEAARLHRQLARQGILTRWFDSPASLRFGLPATEQDWQRLVLALRSLDVA